MCIVVVNGEYEYEIPLRPLIGTIVLLVGMHLVV